MKNYILPCTEKQATRARNLGAPFKETPTAQQMIEWMKDGGVIFSMKDASHVIIEIVRGHVSQSTVYTSVIADNVWFGPFKDSYDGLIDIVLDYLEKENN